MAKSRKGIIFSPQKKKLLLLLKAGKLFALSRGSRRNLYRLTKLPAEFKNVKKQYLDELVREFIFDRLVEVRENDDDTITMVLTEKGEKQVLRFDIDEIKIKKPAKWNGQWTVVFFDIPETKRSARDALRDKLKEIGFFELQKSTFIYPYPCADELNFIIEFFEVRPYVRHGQLSNLSNEAELRLKFGLH